MVEMEEPEGEKVYKYIRELGTRNWELVHLDIG